MSLDRKINRGKRIAAAVGITVALLVAVRFFMPADTAVMPDTSPLPVQNDVNRTDNPSLPDSSAAGSTGRATGANAKGVRVVEGKIIHPTTINYKELQKASATTEKSGDALVLDPGPDSAPAGDSPVVTLMRDRKKRLGVDKSVDMVVRSDEAIIVGGKKVAMADILEKAFVKQGEIFEKRITQSGEARPETVREYGIYVVQPGDNIWNIHFNILTEYYTSRGIRVEPKADEPLDSGLSSGVGKILKFSETIAIIYSINGEKVVEDINLLKPLSKIVIYNMSEVFSLLEEINYSNVNRVQFDGSTIWIPARES